jgi:hypothetical protein
MSTRHGLLVLLAALGGCATSGGTFGPNGYQQGTYRYQVAFAKPQQQVLLDGDCRLDNLRMDEAQKKLVDKSGPDYVATRTLDEDGDGSISARERHEEAIYDLRFVNTRDGGVIWIKAHPMAPSEAALDLDVVLQGYADQLSGNGVYATTNVFSVEHPSTRQFISFVTGRDPVMVGPNLGVSATIELAETERLRLDPKHRASRLKVVLSKMLFAAERPTLAEQAAKPWPTTGCGGKLCEKRPALLVAGYYNDVAHFDAHVPDFDRFLRQVMLPAESTLPPEWRSRPVTPLAAPPPAAAAATP